MRNTLCIRSCTLALLLCSVSACGDDDDTGGTSAAQIDRACRTFCGKFAECDLLLGMSADSCAANCRNQAMMGSSDCEVSEAEAEACIDAMGAAQCSALQSGMTPPECDLCPSSTPPPTSDGGTSGPSCTELAGCCSQLPMASQPGCMAISGSAVDSTCATVLAGYREAGMCI